MYRLGAQGSVTPVLTEIDGKPLPPTNYVIEDVAGRLWITVSTWLSPRALGYRADVADGFVVLVDRRGARIVADGLGYTNELALHPSGRWLWVNETFGRRLSRFAIRDDGTLGPRQTVTTFGKGFFPDGLAFDAEGHAWVVSIVSNSIVRVAPDGKQSPVLEDADAAHVDWVEAAYLSGTMGRPAPRQGRRARIAQHFQHRVRRPVAAHRVPRVPARPAAADLRFPDRRAPTDALAPAGPDLRLTRPHGDPQGFRPPRTGDRSRTPSRARSSASTRRCGHASWTTRGRPAIRRSSRS